MCIRDSAITITDILTALRHTDPDTLAAAIYADNDPRLLDALATTLEGATGPSRRPARQAAAALLDGTPRRGQSAFLVTAEGIDASVVEAALGAALASLSSTQAGAHVSMRPVD